MGTGLYMCVCLSLCIYQNNETIVGWFPTLHMDDLWRVWYLICESGCNSRDLQFIDIQIRFKNYLLINTFIITIINFTESIYAVFMGKIICCLTA